MKLFCLRLKYAYCKEKSKLNLILKFQPDQTYGFWDIAFENSYFIVFVNILIKLMRKIGKICSLILIFAKILPIFYE